MTIERFLAIVNRITAYHRHGNTIPKEALDNLCNAQIELEKQLQNTSSNSEYKQCSKCGREAHYVDHLCYEHWKKS